MSWQEILKELATNLYTFQVARKAGEGDQHYVLVRGEPGVENCSNKQANKQTSKQTKKQKNKKADRQTNNQTDRMLT